MRVIHVNAGNLYGGVESLLVTVGKHASACTRIEHEFALCYEERLSEELRGLGATLHSLGGVRVSQPWTVARARRRLRQVVASAGEETVVLGHAPWSYALAAPAAGDARKVLFAHNPIGGGHWVERWARMHPPDLLLANSQFTLLGSRSAFPRAPAEIWHCPVGAPPAMPPDTRRLVREELGASPDAVVITIAARLEEWKGHRFLLQALARLERGLNWECWIAGGPQRPHEERYLDRLRALASETALGERVRFLGRRRDVPRLLAAADLHCQPNVGPEPFGVAYVEAFHAGLPVVASALGGALELVDEGSGRLVEPHDQVGLAEALHELIVDDQLRGRLGAAARERAGLLCDPKQQLERLADHLAVRDRPELRSAPGWANWVGRFARSTPRGRYRVPALACRLVDELRGPVEPFASTLQTGSGALSFVCDLRDKNAREVCFTQRYEPQETALLELLLRPGDVFVDVGANWGYFTLLAAARVGPRGRVLALEPDERMFQLLERNVDLNALQQVELRQLAAADEPGVVSMSGFAEADGNFGVSSFSASGNGHRHVFQVRTERLDHVVDSAGLEVVDVVKMDIEGAEGLALRGMEEGLRRRRYGCVLLELHPQQLQELGQSAAGVIEGLLELGYTGWRLDHSEQTSRRVAYTDQPDPRTFITPLSEQEALDSWPHAVWLAPGRELPWVR